MGASRIQIELCNPSSGYTLSWENISYSVKNVQILKNLNGFLTPGSITAVVGASGSGKSSFLDVLAGRVPPNLTSGQVSINGSNEIQMKHASRYCAQDDALLTALTVWETLMYSAHFNLPHDTTISKKREIVASLLQEFGLEAVKGTIIGGPLRKGCSGGQIRRVSVASQIIGLRNGILFLDEPTSGLDSVAANAMINCLVGLAQNQNATVIVTIHQPSSETFDLFTHYLILGNGSTVYLGPRGDAIEYFERIGYPIPLRCSPCDHYLKLTSTDFDQNKEVGRVRLESLITTFATTPEYAAINHDIKNISNSRALKSPSSITSNNGFLQKTKYLVSRTFLNSWKNPLAYWIRLAMYVALAILMGTTWLDMSLHQSAVQDRMAGLFFAVAFLSFMSVAGIPAFLEDRLVFFRESGNNLYTVESYLLSNFLVSFPFVFIITVAFSSVVYFLMGFQQSVDKFCVFVAFLFFALIIAEAQTVLVAVAIHIFVAALAVTAFTNGLWMIVQGFFVQKKNIPAFWKSSFHLVNFQKYAYELLITNEMEGLTFSCAEDDCACVIPSVSSNCSFTGEDVLHYFKSGDVSYPQWLGIMAAILFFLKIMTYILLKIQTRKNYL